MKGEEQIAPGLPREGCPHRALLFAARTLILFGARLDEAGHYSGGRTPWVTPELGSNTRLELARPARGGNAHGPSP